ncbi:MAG: PEP-CTERM sorting domain-containing protein [Verrucomicrobiota bacterium]
MKRSFLLPALLFASVTAASALDITRWDFNGTSPTTVPGGASTPSPSLGSGTATVVGGVVGATSFGSGTANGGSSDPAVGTAPDYAWQTSTYPAAAAADTSAGVSFAVSTLDLENIVISYDLRHSNSSSRYEALQYSTDGISFTTAAYFTGAAGDTWFNMRTVDLSGVPGVDNNPNFRFRIVAAFESTALGSGAPNYVASDTGGTAYATTGTWRFDYVTLSTVPEASSALLTLLGASLTLRRRRD